MYHLIWFLYVNHELHITNLHVYLLFPVRLLLNITDVNHANTTTSCSEHITIIPELELWVYTYLTQNTCIMVLLCL